jgi:hypothetical protein
VEYLPRYATGLICQYQARLKMFVGDQHFILLHTKRSVTRKISFTTLTLEVTLKFSGEPEIQGTEKLKEEEIFDAKIAKFLSVRQANKHPQPLLHFCANQGSLTEREGSVQLTSLY